MSKELSLNKQSIAFTLQKVETAFDFMDGKKSRNLIIISSGGSCRNRLVSTAGGALPSIPLELLPHHLQIMLLQDHLAVLKEKRADHCLLHTLDINL